MKMLDIVHKQCNHAHAQAAATASKLEGVAAGVGTYKMKGTEKQFRHYCNQYKTVAAANGQHVLTGEFLIDGLKVCTML